MGSRADGNQVFVVSRFCRRENKEKECGALASVQNRIARPVAALVVADENLGDLWVPERLAGVVWQQVLLRDVGDVFRLGILGEQMIIGLVLVRAHFLRDRLVPLLGVAEERIDIEHDAPERIDPVPHDLANGVFRVSNFIHVATHYTNPNPELWHSVAILLNVCSTSQILLQVTQPSSQLHGATIVDKAGTTPLRPLAIMRQRATFPHVVSKIQRSEVVVNPCFRMHDNQMRDKI